MAAFHIASERSQAKIAMAGLNGQGVIVTGSPVAKPSKRKNAEEGDEVQEIQQPMFYQQYTAVRHQHITNFYITEGVDDPKYYTDMVHRIRTAQPQDIIYLHFNTPGGRLDTGIAIINAINDSAARIIGVLDSKAYSLGTLLFLACDEFVIHDNCQFMIHNFSSGTFGKGNEQQAELSATVKWFGKLCDKYYYPFLSKEELARMQRGEDFWMDSDEVKKRLKNMVRIREEEANPKPKKPRAKKADTATEAPAAEAAAAPTDAEQKADETINTAMPTRRRKGKGLTNGILAPSDAVK